MAALIEAGTDRPSVAQDLFQGISANGLGPTLQALQVPLTAFVLDIIGHDEDSAQRDAQGAQFADEKTCVRLFRLAA